MMIQAKTYNEARLTAINLLSNDVMGYIKSVHIEYSEKDKCFWIDYTEWEYDGEKEPFPT